MIIHTSERASELDEIYGNVSPALNILLRPLILISISRNNAIQTPPIAAIPLPQQQQQTAATTTNPQKMSSTLPCKDCFTGSLTTSVPTGTTSTIHGLPTYVATPPLDEGAVPKGLIVMIPDAYGWEMPNNRVLCDVYAQKGGWLVYLPDFMGGEFGLSLVLVCFFSKSYFLCSLFDLLVIFVVLFSVICD